MDINTKKCSITIPPSDSAIDYRTRLVHNILAKFLGSTTIEYSVTEIHFTATEVQRVKIQALVDTCTDELDSLVEGTVYAFLRKYSLLTPKEIQLEVKTA